MGVGRAIATKVRGVLGLGLLGTVTGVVAMLVQVTAASLSTYGLWPLSIEVSMAASAGALGGLVFGTGFGVTLALLSDRRTILELSLRRVAAMGLVLGAAVPVLLTVAVSGADIFLANIPSVLMSSVTWGACGALLAPTGVAMARHAERLELEKTGPRPRFGTGSTTPSR